MTRYQMSAATRMSNLRFELLRHRAYLENYLKACLPERTQLDPQSLLNACQDQFQRLGAAVGDASGETFKAGQLAYALGWAHAHAWWPQPATDRLITDLGDDLDVVLMRWEYGRCEALESRASSSEMEAIWEGCRPTRKSAGAPVPAQAA
jgi:hypothetical protein